MISSMIMFLSSLLDLQKSLVSLGVVEDLGNWIMENIHIAIR